MYGLVNKAICDFITSNFGQETWEIIAQKAQADESFLSMDAYPDELTYRLVGVISEHLKMPAEKVLEVFGEYWVTFTGQQGYGAVMKMSGNNAKDFLANLNDMHVRVKATMPELQPPKFAVTDVTTNSLTLHYKTVRQGLAPMVLGLVKGVGKMFNQELAVEHVRTESTNPVHEVFTVRF